MSSFGLDIWGDDNFIIEDGKVLINYGNRASLLEITRDIREGV